MSEDASPPSSSSTKSTTPKTDNRGEFVEDNEESHPELAAQQPLLDVVNPAEEEAIAPRQLYPTEPNGKDVKVENRFTNGSPRAINEKESTLLPSSGKAPAPTPPRTPGRHRRTQSEDLVFDQPNYYTTGSYQGGYPPGMPYPAPQMMPGMQQRSFEYGEAPQRGHTRIHSMPQVPSQMYPMMGYPPGRISPSGSPVGQLPPPMNEQGPLLPYARDDPRSSYRKRKSQARTRGPVMMPGVAPGLYGSFDEGRFQEEAPPPPPPNSLNFSPREELLSLTGRGRSTPPSSPRRSRSDLGSPPYTRTPRRSPPPSVLRSPSPRNVPPRGDDARVSFSPGTPLRDGYSAISSAGGPYIYDANGGADYPDGSPYIKRGKKHRSHHSIRKMHMRQQSAQLFMEDTKGSKQPVACRDLLFCLLFVFHLIGVINLGITYSRDALMVNSTGDEWTVNVWYRNVIFISALCGAFAVVLSTVALIIMTVIVQRLVQVSLILTITLSFAWGTIGIGLSPRKLVPITGIVALALAVGYAFCVWDRIPFASANLKAGLTGVRRNAGTVLVAFAFQFLAVVWSIYYTFVVLGVYDALNNGDLDLSKHATAFVYSMLCISYLWTYNVLLHVVQVTVAGTIGSWWFKPDSESSFCDRSVTESFCYATFYSFGSICFGSLLVEPVRLLRQLAVFARPSEEESALMCLHECFACVQKCITACVDNLASYFNPWAFTYIGLYHYGMLEAGHSATILFQKRGWTTIVSDDLIHNVLLMVSVVIGGVTGCFGVLIQELDQLSLSSFEKPVITSFIIGLFMGLVVTSVLFGIISSSVNAVIVLFAGSPVEFEKYHPELSHDLRAAWREVWPGCMDIIDIRVANMNQESIPIV